MASIEKFPRVDMAKLEAEVTLPRVSAITAETVTRDFESALKEIEAMGAELISVAKKCEAMTTDVQSTIRETAEAYRQEGKKIFELIEERALSTEDIRKTCGDAILRMREGNGGVQ
jgi:pyruvate/2-oxoacid:ferredoxin oxidoreductase beta subunit